MSVDPQPSRSVPDLLGDLLRETTELFRTEGRLIRAEISEKITQVQIGGGSIAAGAICLLVALIVLAQALVIALAHVVGAGWSALIVGILVAVVGVLLLAKGKKDLEVVNLAPDRTLDQLQKDGRLVKEQTR
ncbi:phage holin family protein [Aureimonas sp. ME7]|uniref:phage holin family protein n=1 Tax=Aureimonas sp. ME7 TaxID=2744252 RepID=UPI0015F3A4E0|nr:phage holin family protein [Aureimonas sp. ME7]